jgi:PKD repeat protein
LGTNVVLSDTLPTGLTYGGGDGTHTGGDVTWTFDIGPGDAIGNWFTATLPCSGTVTNDDYRVVSSDQGVTSTAGPAVDLAIVAPALTADFDQSEDTITVNDTVAFTDTSTTDGPAITDWQWGFGDGSAKVTTQDASHQYTSAGVFTVTLTITDACGYSDSHAAAVTVESDAVAGFTASPTAGVAPMTVTFTNTSTGGYTSSLWAFGDSVTSTEESPTHTYDAFGIYTVSLTVDVGLPGADTLTRTDYITASHEADVTYDCVVDVDDVQAVAGNWRCEEGDLCYHEHQDLDGDKIITVIDIMKVVALWNWTCSDGPPAGPTMLPPWWWDGGG